MKNSIAVAGLMLGTLCSSAHADVYVGVGAGSSSTTAVNVGAMKDGMGLQFDYINVGSLNTTDKGSFIGIAAVGEISMRDHAANAAAENAWLLPLSLHAKAGFGQGTTKFGSGSGDYKQSGLYYGLGMGYDVTHNIMIGLDWTSVPFNFVPATVSPMSINQNIFALSGTYRF